MAIEFQFEIWLVGFMSTVLYFLTYKNGPIKIGKSKDPTERLRMHQTSVPFDLYFLGIIKDMGHIERRLHETFSDLKIRGEWFRREKSLLEYIQENSTEYFPELSSESEFNNGR